MKVNYAKACTLPQDLILLLKSKHPENYTPSDFRHNPGSN
jgi:hypothetical protein